MGVSSSEPSQQSSPCTDSSFLMGQLPYAGYAGHAGFAAPYPYAAHGIAPAAYAGLAHAAPIAPLAPVAVAHAGLGLPEARAYALPPVRQVAEAPIVEQIVEPVEQWGYKVAY